MRPKRESRAHGKGLWRPGLEAAPGVHQALLLGVYLEALGHPLGVLGQHPCLAGEDLVGSGGPGVGGQSPWVGGLVARVRWKGHRLTGSSSSASW